MSFDSPFIVPLGAFVVAIVGIIAAAANRAHSEKLRADQRMAMLARGVNPAEIEGLLTAAHDVEDRVPNHPTRRMGNSRRSAMVLISCGLGIMFFGFALAWIVREREVLVVAASGLVPLMIGIGFLADYTLQRRDVESLQVALGDEKMGDLVSRR
jgi:hypothetical protein